MHSLENIHYGDNMKQLYFKGYTCMQGLAFAIVTIVPCALLVTDSQLHYIISYLLDRFVRGDPPCQYGPKFPWETLNGKNLIRAL